MTWRHIWEVLWQYLSSSKVVHCIRYCRTNLNGIFIRNMHKNYSGKTVTCYKLYKEYMKSVQELWKTCSRYMSDLYSARISRSLFLIHKKLFSFDFMELGVLIFVPVKTVHLFLAYASCFYSCESCLSFPNSFARISNRSFAHAHIHV
jgi:hypothetical protein